MREVVLIKVRLEALGEGGGSRSNTPTCRFQDERRVVSRSAKWTSRHLGGSSWNRPQRPNPGHLRDCWGCLGRFLGRLGHRTTAIVSTRGVGKSLEFRPGAPRDFSQVDRNARE